MCPHCQSIQSVIKRGFYQRPSDQRCFQRFHCKECGKSFSTQTSSYTYRLRKRKNNQSVFRLLSKGMSQRGIAQVLSLTPRTVARRVVRFGDCAKKHIEQDTRVCHNVVFDEMESFEHTKMKPLTIALAVESGTRRILSLKVGKIAAKGHLAQKSVARYGKRKCQRAEVLDAFLIQLKRLVPQDAHFSSDESPHYPDILKKHFPKATHTTHKGRRGCVTGQGEMKSGGFDPLFSLNQTAAMIRDNIKRMARKTWCTTKLISRLQRLLYTYAFYHNQILDGSKKPRIWDL